MIIVRDGTPYTRPEKPAPDASIEEKVAYLRAVADYRDRIAADASWAFAEAFARAIRQA